MDLQVKVGEDQYICLWGGGEVASCCGAESLDVIAFRNSRDDWVEASRLPGTDDDWDEWRLLKFIVRKAHSNIINMTGNCVGERLPSGNADMVRNRGVSNTAGWVQPFRYPSLLKEMQEQFDNPDFLEYIGAAAVVVSPTAPNARHNNRNGIASATIIKRVA